MHHSEKDLYHWLVQSDEVNHNTKVKNPTIAKSEQSNKTSKRQKPNLFEERSDELFGYYTSF